MKNHILSCYKEWKTDRKKSIYYDITDNDRRVSEIAAMYSESDLRHATVMKAAYNRLRDEFEQPITIRPSPTTDSVA